MRPLLAIPAIFLAFLFMAPFAVLASLVFGSGRATHFIAKWWAKAVLWIAGVHVEVEGLDNLPTDAPVVLACNHASQFDIPVLLATLPVPFRFVVKKELFRIPFFGLTMRRAGYIPIDRSGGKAAMRSLQEAAEAIRCGASVLVFPEGTRSADGRLAPFKVGGILLAIKSGRPIAPIALSGTHRVLPKGSLRVHPGRVKLSVAPLVATVEGPSPRRKDAVTEEAWNAIASRLEEGNRP